ncbi:MAG: DUF421 domain-containing protein [Eubacteriaceae bacterium]
MAYFNIGLELVVGYISLFVITKVIGKTLITQITPFDFISAIVLSELVGNGLYDDKVGIPKILFAICIWGILIYTTEILTQKFKSLRSLFEGRPSILIHKGKIVYKELKKNHIDINQLQHMLRMKDAFSIREVEYAILETDGSINILKKSKYASPTINDHKLPESPIILPVTLIMDGEIIKDNLTEIGFSEEWLKSQIKLYELTKVKDVLYAEWQENKGLFIQGY